MELLVVIAILCLLLGILAPTLSRTKSMALRSQCSVNQRQWGQGLAAYAANNKMAFPYNGRPIPPNIPVEGRDVSWNGTVVNQFFRDSTSMGSWFYTPSVPFSNHIQANGQPEGSNFLFEDGRVGWYENGVILLGATMGGWDFHYKIPL